MIKARIMQDYMSMGHKMAFTERIDHQTSYFNFSTNEWEYKSGYSTMEHQDKCIIHIPEGVLQSLTDELYKLGYKPNNIKEYDTQLKEKDKHLQDMRKIVSKKIGVDLG